MKDSTELRYHLGIHTQADGTQRPARFFHAAGEPCPGDEVVLDPAHYATWTDEHGHLCVRRGASSTVGATKAYSAAYDGIDWGN